MTIGSVWSLLKQTVLDFIDDDALSKGAAIAFYAATSIGPVLVIVIAIGGLFFGHEAAQNQITREISGVMGQQSAEMLQAAIKSASNRSAGIIATIIALATLLITASGVFGEMQSTLNAIWKVKPRYSGLSRQWRARAASLGLVAALGFLLMVSLIVSAGINALSDFIDTYIPLGSLLLSLINFVVSFSLISVLFAAIYKVLPDTPLEWRDVIIGAIVTALLFTGGKSLIALYLGSSAVASSYGAAGALIVVLLWIYYSAQIFLLGAEFTKVYAAYRVEQAKAKA